MAKAYIIGDGRKTRAGQCRSLSLASEPRLHPHTGLLPFLAMQAQRQQPQSSTDLSFFSKPKNTKSGSSTPVTRSVVTTRVVTTHRTPATSKPPGAVKVVARDTTPASTSRASHSATPPVARKRKVAHDAPPSQPKVKKPRLSTSPAPSRASSFAPSAHPSGPATRQSSLVPRGAGRNSRAHSAAPSPPLPPVPRDLWIEEDGRLGPDFVSCEDVVKKLMGSYKACKFFFVVIFSFLSGSFDFSDFTNPHDPNDKSFDPHLTGYPVVELEYPNTYASERFVLLSAFGFPPLTFD